MVKAVNNPTDVEELIKYAHRISCTYGAVAPDNWTPGDPRRPYPNKEEIRRGFLGHLDDSGKFLPSLKDVVAQMQPNINTPASGFMDCTPGQQQQMASGSSSQLPNPTSVSSESLENSCKFFSLDKPLFLLFIYLIHLRGNLEFRDPWFIRCK